MSCDVGWSHFTQLIFQPFCRFTYITAHSLTLLLLHIRHSSFSSLPSLHLSHSSFSNPSVAPPTSQALHQRHLASRHGSIMFFATQGVPPIGACVDMSTANRWVNKCKVSVAETCDLSDNPRPWRPVTATSYPLREWVESMSGSPGELSEELVT